MPDNPLLQWTLDAKRALQQAEQLSSHANNLVSDSAASLDNAESLIPKCLFLREALRGQVGLLEKLGKGCYSVEDHARREFEVFIKELDTLDIELNEILGRLKSVSLDPGFDAVNAPELRQTPPRKSLHDFVDEQGIEKLKTQLRQAIDEVQDSHDVLSSSLSTLESEIRNLNSLIDSIQLPPSLPPLSHSSESLAHSKSTTYTTHPEKQDYHAHSLALLLTSLAQHYDQTSSALKDHESPLGTIPDIDPETLEILSHDANEVTEVLEEMEDHVREIEHSSDVLQTHSLEITQTYTHITTIFSQLEEYGKIRLPQHLLGVKDFESRASMHRDHISTLKQEMFNLVEYYTNFSTAYDSLLLEVRRRSEVQQHTGLLVTEIAQKLGTLYEQEVRARQGFMDKHAAFLPEDLWRGIYDPPSRFSLVAEEGGVLPLLRDSLVGGGGGKRLSSAGMERRRSAMGGSGESNNGRRSIDSGGRRSAEIQPRR